jgi:hypothetical protein
LLRSLILTVALAACGSDDDQAPTSPPPAYVPGELLVELPPGVADSTVARRVAEEALLPVRVTVSSPAANQRRWPVAVRCRPS